MLVIHKAKVFTMHYYKPYCEPTIAYMRFIDWMTFRAVPNKMRFRASAEGSTFEAINLAIEKSPLKK